MPFCRVAHAWHSTPCPIVAAFMSGLDNQIPGLGLWA